MLIGVQYKLSHITVMIEHIFGKGREWNAWFFDYNSIIFQLLSNIPQINTKGHLLMTANDTQVPLEELVLL